METLGWVLPTLGHSSLCESGEIDTRPDDFNSNICSFQQARIKPKSLQQQLGVATLKTAEMRPWTNNGPGQVRAKLIEIGSQKEALVANPVLVCDSQGAIAGEYEYGL